MTKYLVFDTETTGLPDMKQPADAVGQPRLASIAMLFVSPAFDIQCEWFSLVLPDGWGMGAEASAINGLTTERLAADGLSVRYALEIYARAIDEGRTVVAHNVVFDTKIMRGELRRAGMDDRYARTSTVCTMTHGRRFCSRGKLSVVYEELTGKPLDGAHNARNDAHACLNVLRELRDRIPLAVA